MPWCEECAKYFAPSAMRADGTCPACGRPIDPPAPAAGSGEATHDENVPWHFKLMVVALVAYLVWRFYEILA